MTEEQVQEVEKWAGCFYSADQIAIIMQVPREALMGSKVQQAMERGRLKAAGEIRMAVLAQAKAGSTPAQQMALRFQDELAREEVRKDA